MLSQSISVSFFFLTHFSHGSQTTVVKYKLDPVASLLKTLKCFPFTLLSNSNLPTPQTQCLLSTPYPQKPYSHHRPLHLLCEMPPLPRSLHNHLFIFSQVFMLLSFPSVWCLWLPCITQQQPLPPFSVISLLCYSLQIVFVSLRNDLYIHLFILILPNSLPWFLAYNKYSINNVYEWMS